MKKLEFVSVKKEEFIDITQLLKEYVAESGFQEGLLNLFLPHTTAGLMINDKLPAVCHDVSLYLDKHVPENLAYIHEAGNSPAHIKAAILGNSLAIPFIEGKLQIGEWQAVYVCEFDGPKDKGIWLTVIK